MESEQHSEKTHVNTNSITASNCSFVLTFNQFSEPTTQINNEDRMKSSQLRLYSGQTIIRKKHLELERLLKLHRPLMELEEKYLLRSRQERNKIYERLKDKEQHSRCRSRSNEKKVSRYQISRQLSPCDRHYNNRPSRRHLYGQKYSYSEDEDDTISTIFPKYKSALKMYERLKLQLTQDIEEEEKHEKQDKSNKGTQLLNILEVGSEEEDDGVTAADSDEGHQQRGNTNSELYVRQDFFLQEIELLNRVLADLNIELSQAEFSC